MKMYLTAIGKDIFKMVGEVAENSITSAEGVKVVNTVNTVKLGNLNGKTYIIEVDKDFAFALRKKIVDELNKYSAYIMGMTVNGEWFKIFAFSKLALKTHGLMKEMI